MKTAILDLGTNTFHLLVAAISEDATAKILHRESTFVKIGHGGISDGYLTEAAQQRAISALVHFRNVANSLGATHSFATATSAIRSAKNGQEFLAHITRETGFIPQTISGQQEAEWIYRGIAEVVSIAANETALIMDIGGGSVEFIIANSVDILWKQSFEIGAQRLLDRFADQDPISANSLQALEAYAEEKLHALWLAAQQFKPDYLIGSAGTFDTLSQMDDPTQPLGFTEVRELDLDTYQQLHQLLISQNRQFRLAIPGMIPERADMIVPASALLNYVMKKTGLRSIKVSAASLKEGVLNRICAKEIAPLPLPR